MTKLKVEEFAQVVGGGTPSTTNHSYWDGDIAWITPKDLSGFSLRYISRGERNISEEGLKNSSATLLPENAVLLSTRAPVGYVAISKNPISTNQGFKSLICDPDKAHFEFIYYLLKNNKRFLEANATGATYKELPGGRLKTLEFSLPPVQEQIKISKVLASYDDLIENNIRRISLLEKSAQLLYKEWFVRFKFPGYEHTKFVDGIPEGWVNKSVFDVVDVLSGGTPKTAIMDYWDGYIPFYTPKDYTNNFYVFETEKNITDEGLKHCNSKLYDKDTIFISARGTVGNITLAARPMAMNQSCYALIGKDGISQYYLYLGLNQIIAHFKQSAQGAVFDAIVVDTFKRIPFLLANANIIENFDEIIIPYFNQIEILLKMNIRLKLARNLLLPALMNGDFSI